MRRAFFLLAVIGLAVALALPACGGGTPSPAQDSGTPTPAKIPDCLYSTQEGELCSVSFFCDAGDLNLYCQPADGGYACNCRVGMVRKKDVFLPDICKQGPQKRLELAASACEWVKSP